MLLPKRMRGAAAAFYAFCRIADDLVDFSDDPTPAVLELGRAARSHLRGTARRRPRRSSVRVGSCADHEIPRAVVDALIEGFEWDADEREYESLSDVLGYCARVASAVGVVMTLLMGPREPRTIARACDLGARCS